MTLLYDARCSFVFLRPKMRSNSQHKVQTSAFVWGNGLYHAGRFYFSGFRMAQDIQIFLEAPFATNAIPKKGARTDEGEGGKSKLGSRGPVFADFRAIFVFWALLLKN